jgi:hypothetical protein
MIVALLQNVAEALIDKIPITPSCWGNLQFFLVSSAAVIC